MQRNFLNQSILNYQNINSNLPFFTSYNEVKKTNLKNFYNKIQQNFNKNKEINEDKKLFPKLLEQHSLTNFLPYSITNKFLKNSQLAPKKRNYRKENFKLKTEIKSLPDSKWKLASSAILEGIFKKNNYANKTSKLLRIKKLKNIFEKTFN